MPTYVSGSATGVSSHVSSVTITAPSGIVAGNLLIALIGGNPGDSLGSATVTPPSGWTLIENPTVNPYVAAFYKYATGSEPANYTFSGMGWLAGAILQYSGTASSSPVDVYGNNNGTGTGAATAPTITTTTNGDLIIAAVYDYNGQSFSTPTGLTARASARVAGSDSIYTWDTTQGTAGATGSYSSTPSGSALWGSLTLSIKAGTTVAGSGTSSVKFAWSSTAVIGIVSSGTSSIPLRWSATAVVEDLDTGLFKVPLKWSATAQTLIPSTTVLTDDEDAWRVPLEWSFMVDVDPPDDVEDGYTYDVFTDIFLEVF